VARVVDSISRALILRSPFPIPDATRLCRSRATSSLCVARAPR
jgi:hypothetical protein